MIIYLNDGYQGDRVAMHAEPIRIDGDMALLRCAEPEKSFLVRWIQTSQLESLVGSMQDRLQRHQPVSGMELAELVELEIADAHA